MLPDHFDLEIVTPERHVLHEAVQSLELPGQEGYLGILPGHAPLLTELGIGPLTYSKGKDIQYFAVSRGYAEVLPNRVIVLADACERAEEIDVERARAARDRAKERLANGMSSDVDWDRATFALNRALARLQAAAKGGSSGASDTALRGA